MAFKTGVEYADDVRELRAQGIDFPSASSGYILADAANWSSGQKAAVTRAINEFDFEDEEPEPEPEAEPEREGIDDEIAEQFFDDGFGEPDDLDEYDDIPYFDPSEAEEFIDEDSDAYSEDEA